MANRTPTAISGWPSRRNGRTFNGRTDCLGHPLQINNLGQREYAQSSRRPASEPIKFHGMRHTCATLLLQAGTPVHVVSERLGHSKVSMTLEVYAHVLPDMQRDAATPRRSCTGVVSNPLAKPCRIPDFAPD